MEASRLLPGDWTERPFDQPTAEMIQQYVDQLGAVSPQGTLQQRTHLNKQVMNFLAIRKQRVRQRSINHVQFTDQQTLTSIRSKYKETPKMPAVLIQKSRTQTRCRSQEKGRVRNHQQGHVDAAFFQNCQHLQAMYTFDKQIEQRHQGTSVQDHSFSPHGTTDNRSRLATNEGAASGLQNRVVLADQLDQHRRGSQTSTFSHTAPGIHISKDVTPLGSQLAIDGSMPDVGECHSIDRGTIERASISPEPKTNTNALSDRVKEDRSSGGVESKGISKMLAQLREKTKNVLGGASLEPPVGAAAEERNYKMVRPMNFAMDRMNPGRDHSIENVESACPPSSLMNHSPMLVSPNTPAVARGTA